MLALCLMLLVTYYAFNYAGIIGRGLADAYLQWADQDKFGQSITSKYLTIGLQDSREWLT